MNSSGANHQHTYLYIYFYVESCFISTRSPLTLTSFNRALRRPIFFSCLSVELRVVVLFSTRAKNFLDFYIIILPTALWESHYFTCDVEISCVSIYFLFALPCSTCVACCFVPHPRTHTHHFCSFSFLLICCTNLFCDTWPKFIRFGTVR
uniref:Uncharacterized protein n=1 Tax=Trypanosoma congolense (strain IL3000) TaxID=1068625 RepID=F9WCG3_TRYCI|nr:hypothetical protein, unlikely [Trypanosoma congolense IL3000]